MPKTSLVCALSVLTSFAACWIDSPPQSEPLALAADANAPSETAPGANAIARGTTDGACSAEPCCMPPKEVGSFRFPAHMAWVHWTLATTPLSAISFNLKIHDDPGTRVGLFISPINSTIDDSQFYLGLQTDMGIPEKGSVGKGILFTRFGTMDESMVRAGPTATTLALPDEGTFVSVRAPYDWRPGEYRFELERKEAIDVTDWFDLSATRVDTNEKTLLGGIRFPRKTPGKPATITPYPITFLETYHGPKFETFGDYADVPAWHVSLTMSGDGKAPISASSSYPDFPFVEYPNVDVYYADDRVHLVGGGTTAKCHAAGDLF